MARARRPLKAGLESDSTAPPAHSYMHHKSARAKHRLSQTYAHYAHCELSTDSFKTMSLGTRASSRTWTLMWPRTSRARAATMGDRWMPFVQPTMTKGWSSRTYPSRAPPLDSTPRLRVSIARVRPIAPFPLHPPHVLQVHRDSSHGLAKAILAGDRVDKRVFSSCSFYMLYYTIQYIIRYYIIS